MRALSDTEPQPIEIDQVVAGRARLLVHWDVQPVTITDEDGTTRTAYEYEEKAVWLTTADPKAAIATRTAGLIAAASKERIIAAPVVRDTATGLPGKVAATTADPVVEDDATVRAQRERGYRVLPMPRRPPKLPPAPPQPPAEPVGDVVIRRA